MGSSVPFLRSGAKSLELMCLGNVGQDSIKCEGGPFIHKVIFTKNAHTQKKWHLFFLVMYI